MHTGLPKNLPHSMVDRATIAYTLDAYGVADAIAIALGVQPEHAAEAIGITIDASILYGIILSTPVLMAVEPMQ
jgi:hypothetical protein